MTADTKPDGPAAPLVPSTDEIREGLPKPASRKSASTKAAPGDAPTDVAKPTNSFEAFCSFSG